MIQQLPYTFHMQSSTIRTFFACELSKENLVKVDHLLTDLRRRIPRSVKWVGIQNAHLTLQFLGEFKLTDVPTAQTNLQKALVNQKSFPLHIHNTGAFPSLPKPKVIWLGIDPQPLLFDLVKIVTGVTRSLGYPADERPFSAHITLGRVKPYASPADLAEIKRILLELKDVEIGCQNIDCLHFIKSDLTPDGPHYQDLFCLPFSS